MRNSLQSSYEMERSVEERIRHSRPAVLYDARQVPCIDCQHNEGLKRIKQIIDLIDSAVKQLDQCDSAGASNIYLRTLEAVALISRHAKVAEKSFPELKP